MPIRASRLSPGSSASVAWLITSMKEQRRTWRKCGTRLAVGCAALAWSVFATVHHHPEQDLPLWPAWILSGGACIGVAVVGASWSLGPLGADSRLRRPRDPQPTDAFAENGTEARAPHLSIHLGETRSQQPVVAPAGAKAEHRLKVLP
jgi:hypothetical protein